MYIEPKIQRIINITASIFVFLLMGILAFVIANFAVDKTPVTRNAVENPTQQEEDGSVKAVEEEIYNSKKEKIYELGYTDARKTTLIIRPSTIMEDPILLEVQEQILKINKNDKKPTVTIIRNEKGAIETCQYKNITFDCSSGEVIRK